MRSRTLLANDGRWFYLDQLDGSVTNATNIGTSQDIDVNISAFSPAQLTKPLDECRDSFLSLGIVLVDRRQ
jgi:hypothetical protein